MPEDRPDFDEHRHEALVHDHEHWHVTHNYKDGGFEHLSWKHGHGHDHAAVAHSHLPHEDFESEHLDEAHDHDHAEPVKERLPSDTSAEADAAGKIPARKRTAKKSTATKKATKKAAKKTTKKSAKKATG